MRENGLNWFCWDAAVVIILPERLLGLWEGISLPSAGRVVTATFRFDPSGPAATDYDRACSIEASIAPISVGDGTGIVITNAPMLAWVPNGDGGYVVIALGWNDLTDDLVSRVATEMLEYEFVEPTFTFENPDARLFVLAAADTFGNPYGYGNMPIQLLPGIYRITTAERRLNDIEQFRVHRYQKI